MLRICFTSGIDVSHQTVRYWWNRFGPLFAAEIRRKRARHLRARPQWRWHLDEVFLRINGKIHYLWRAVDHEGEVLEAYVTKRRDRKAALKFLREAMKRYGRPNAIVTDKLGISRRVSFYLVFPTVYRHVPQDVTHGASLFAMSSPR